MCLTLCVQNEFLHISNDDRHKVVLVDMTNAGMTVKIIAHQFNCNRSKISRILMKVGEPGSFTDIPKSGRRRNTTPRRVTTLLFPLNMMPSFGGFQNKNIHQLNTMFLIRQLAGDKSAKLKYRHPYVGIQLTPNHRLARLE